jgi:hypothetical protein
MKIPLITRGFVVQSQFYNFAVRWDCWPHSVLRCVCNSIFICNIFETNEYKKKQLDAVNRLDSKVSSGTHAHFEKSEFLSALRRSVDVVLTSTLMIFIFSHSLLLGEIKGVINQGYISNSDAGGVMTTEDDRHFRNDNAEVWDILWMRLKKGEYQAYIKPYLKRQDGRAAFTTLHHQLLGRDAGH